MNDTEALALIAIALLSGILIELLMILFTLEDIRES